MTLVRYGDSVNAKHIQNQIHGEEQDEDLKENLAKYPSKFKWNRWYSSNALVDPLF